MAINKRFTQLNNSGSNHNLLDKQIDVVLSLCVLNLEFTKPAFAMCSIYGDPALIQEPADKPANAVNIEPEIDL